MGIIKTLVILFVAGISLVTILALIAYLVFWEQVSYGLAFMGIPTKNENNTCKISGQCKTFFPGKVGTLACCTGKCAKQIPDYLGIGYCPEECKAGLFSPAGSCGKSSSVAEGGSCSANTDCKGFTSGQASLGCDNGVCRQMKKDYLGVYYNASECKSSLWSSPGSC